MKKHNIIAIVFIVVIAILMITITIFVIEQLIENAPKN